MRSKLLLATGSVLAIIALAGCTPNSGAASPEPSSASEVPSASPTPETRTIEISLDGLSLDKATPVAYTDDAGILSLLSGVLGPQPSGTPGPDGYGFTTYDWGSVRVTTSTQGKAGVWVGEQTVDGVTFQGPDGVEVGWTREQALAAGAKDLPYDGDGDGKADQLAIGAREVAGTTSLADPSKTGQEYVMLVMKGDTVAHIFSNGNDFSDL